MPTIYYPGLNATITFVLEFKPGDPEPDGYLDWHEWARVQHRAGLRQVQCPTCGRWKYPQSLSTREITWTGRDRRGRVRQMTEFECLKCAEKRT